MSFMKEVAKLSSWVWGWYDEAMNIEFFHLLGFCELLDYKLLASVAMYYDDADCTDMVIMAIAKRRG